jgi:hypothetical protein
MMYNNKLAVAIKHNGKVLREVGDSVYIPFGSEYSIFIKNLNSVRVRVKIEVDGADVGEQFIVNANSEMDLERFVTNLRQGNRFKFIERSGDIEEHRGIGVEDGLIRVEFEFEQDWKDLWNNRPRYMPTVRDGSWWSGPNSGDQLYGGSFTTCSTRSLSSSVVPQNDAGITVPGSISDQKFTTTSDILSDGVKHVMVLRLLGQTADNRQVIQPVTVKSKPKCVTCGRTNKSNAKFCSNCGTSLVLV